MTRRILLPFVALLLIAFASSDAGAQEAAIRFEISGVGDSTFSFAVGQHVWVESGQRGIVVDPRRRDALVARFRVTRVQSGLATAVVTGQTSPLSTQHAALLERPRPPFYRQPSFWVGLVVGGAIGFFAGS